jgi:hypothetical protein
MSTATPTGLHLRRRSRSITTEIEVASHVPMISPPDPAAELIISAYNTVTA